MYAELFAASGRYYDHGELLVPASLDRLRYGTGGTTIRVEPNGDRIVTAGDSTFPLRNRDFNARSFRSNVVLRWEWRPGSTLFMVWQQNRNVSEPIGTPVGLGDLFGSISAPGANVLLVKTSFWIPAG